MICAAISCWASSTSAAFVQTVMPMPMRAGVLGMARTRQRVSSFCCRADSGAPARMEMTSLPGPNAPFNALAAWSRRCGLTARMTTSAALAASALLVVMRTPSSACSWLSRSWFGPAIKICSGGSFPVWIRLNAMVLPITPGPIIAMFLSCSILTSRNHGVPRVCPLGSLPIFVVLLISVIISASEGSFCYATGFLPGALRVTSAYAL